MNQKSMRKKKKQNTTTSISKLDTVIQTELMKDISDISDDELMENIQDNIAVGECLQYRELAYFCGLPYKSGNQRINQFKRLERFMRFERLSRKDGYLITDIFDRYLPAKRKRRSDAVYQPYIEIALFSYFYHAGKTYDMKPQKGWWMTLGIVNQAYLYYDKLGRRREMIVDTKKEKKENNTAAISSMPTFTPDQMDLSNVYFFYHNVYKKIHGKWEEVLDKMVADDLISYSTVYKIRREQNGLYFIANPKETEIIDNIRDRVVADLGYESYDKLVMRQVDIDKFDRMVNDALEPLGMYDMFVAIEIYSHISKDKMKEYADRESEIMDYGTSIGHCFEKKIRDAVKRFAISHSINKKDLVYMEGDAAVKMDEDDIDAIFYDDIFDRVTVQKKWRDGSIHEKEYKNFLVRQNALLDSLLVCVGVKHTDDNMLPA